MATIKATDRRRGRAFLLAALAALGVLGATAGEVTAQAYRDYGFAYGPGGYEPAAYQGRGYGRGGPYGPPPGYGGPGPGGGFHRGQVLPPDQRDRYVDDPGRYHLRAPPNGYGWVGDGRNAYLMQRSTGMVLDSVPGAYEPAPRFERGGRGGQSRMENRSGGGGRNFGRGRR